MARETSPHPQNTWYGNSWRVRLGLIVASVAILASVLVVRYYWSAEPANAQMPSRASNRAAQPNTQPAANQPMPEKINVMAKVNGEPISRTDLANECLRHYGEEVLEGYLNRRLIAMECERRNLRVTPQEIDAEVEQMAKHFNFTVQQWYQMLEKERGIKPKQYASDIIWPTLALRKLAGQRMQVTEQELREAYETQFGPSVNARLIATKDPNKAEQLHAKAKAHPDDFGQIALDESEDVTSASNYGWIPAIRKHGGPKEIEATVFAMKDGEISPVIHVPNSPATADDDQYVIVKREKFIAAREVPLDKVMPNLRRLIEERKLRTVAQDVFRELQKKSQVENYLTNHHGSCPEVVASINGQRITAGQLAEACLERHGKDVLEGTISRKLIEQALRKANMTVTDADLRAEVERVAKASVPPKPDGSADIKAWLNLVTEQKGISSDVYINDEVWPSVALHKLIGEKVTITEEDIQRGFEANYGPRVRCLAIVCDQHRHAQRAWTLARDKHQSLKALCDKQQAGGTSPEQVSKMFFREFAESFGDLAEQFSIEPSSKQLRGQVPPIKKYGGQPILEKEAFALKPGELSGIIQADDKFVILFCEGYTKPDNIDPKSVRQLIIDDIREKKQWITMAQYFDHLKEFARIDNYLAGTTQAPSQQSQGMHPSDTMRPAPTRR